MTPAELVASVAAWQECLAHLRTGSRLAIDTEANSMYAYRERICLIQISSDERDFILDPLAFEDDKLEELGNLLADAHLEKVLHSAEYDLILFMRERGWEVQNLFDTMWAARILGIQRLGLASLLGDLYQLKLDKRFQRANWCRRPLPREQLAYAQADTHFLLDLRDHLAAQLKDGGHWVEAQEIFGEQCRVNAESNEFSPDSFWSIKGVKQLSPPGRAVLKALNIYRDQVARSRNFPPFKIMGDRTLLELAQTRPHKPADLQEIYGMTHGQVRRYGRRVLQIIRENERKPAPRRPRRKPRPPDDVLNRYEQLRTWRKERGQQRGVESDVILSRDMLWQIARLDPQTVPEMAAADILGPWRLETYGREIIQLLRQA